MNKKLVAVAIAGLLAAPLAQAQTANVTLYGRVNMDMEFVNGRQARRTPNPNIYRVELELVALRPSRHRVARRRPQCDLPDRERLGQHDDTAAATSAGRDTFVGLSGGWGTFKMGRFLAPYDDIHGIFGNDTDAARRRILSTAVALGAGLRRPAGERRLRRSRCSNSIRYDSPSMSGFAARGAIRDQRGHAGDATATTRATTSAYQQRPVQPAWSPTSCHHNIRGTAAVAAVRLGVLGRRASGSSRSFNIAGVYEKLNYDVQNGPIVEQASSATSGRVNSDDQRRRQRADLPVLRLGVSDGTGSALDTPAPVVTSTASSRRTSRASPAWPRATTPAPRSGKSATRTHLSKRTQRLHRLHEDQQRLERELQLQHQLATNLRPAASPAAS